MIMNPLLVKALFTSRGVPQVAMVMGDFARDVIVNVMIGGGSRVAKSYDGAERNSSILTVGTSSTNEAMVLKTLQTLSIVVSI